MATFVGKFKGPRGFSQIPFRTAADQWEPSHTLAKALPASITRRQIGSIVLRRGHIQRWMCLFKSFLPAPFIYSGAEARRSAAMHSCITNDQSRGDLQSGFALFCSKPRSKKKKCFSSCLGLIHQRLQESGFLFSADFPPPAASSSSSSSSLLPLRL